MSGVIPPIFASSIILFPASLVQFFGNGGASGATGVLQKIANALSPGQPLYTLLYGFLIVFFCFFYTALVFDSRETADNLKKSGAFVPGVRPGAMTAKYIDRSEDHTSELQSLMRLSYAVCRLKKKKKQ